jgi:acyl carrier protein
MAAPLVSATTIEDEVRRAVAKALRKEEAAVGLDASIVEDLGGTSLDFLDITFRLEQAFGIKLPHTVLVDQMEEVFGEGKAVDARGGLTKEAVEILRLRLGDSPVLKPGMFADEVTALVTPRTLAEGVKEVLAHVSERCGCGASTWKAEGTKVACGTCGRPATYPDGDALSRDWLRQAAREKRLFAVA